MILLAMALIGAAVIIVNIICSDINEEKQNEMRM